MNEIQHPVPFHLLGRLSPRARWWRPLLEFVVLVVVFAVAFIALTEGLRALVGERADGVLGHDEHATDRPTVHVGA